ncbi:pyrin-like [Cebidichthys violaceus]|uniref:pyrin-like n=1 Tax=Cebidichthys violaceus TaxID=271503 RepID=UPI0035CA560E
MAVLDLLLETLEDLLEKDFKKFKWWLGNGGDFSPIPRSYLEKADQMDTVTKMIETYGEEMAVKIAVDVLKKMCNNNAAEKLKNRYAAGGNTSAVAPSAAPAAPPAAPASIMAQQGSVIFAPNISGCTTGTWNINIPK